MRPSALAGLACLLAIWSTADAAAQTAARPPTPPATRSGGTPPPADDAEALAQVALGESYRFGRNGLARDPAKACDVWDAVKTRTGVAAHDLAQCFYDGVGRPQDYAAARLWYGKAAELGFVPSGCALGNMMIKGLGGERNAARGLALCQQAAASGDANAQADMGDYYLGSGGVLAADPAQAKLWYQKAALQGQPNAAFNLAVIYWNGDGGVARDRDEAVRWWRKAFEWGRADAARYLGDWAFLRFQSGAVQSGSDVLLEEAIDWYRKAADGAADDRARSDALRALGAAQEVRRAAPGAHSRGAPASTR